MTEIDEARRTSFDAVARTYDQMRPGYPKALYDDLLIDVPPGGRTLELGAGTGKATIELARRGLEVIALEPGPKLADIAAEAVTGFPRVKIVRSRFEDWPLEANAFDLVAAAQSFHWIDPAIGLPKIAAALRKDGTVGLFWNTTLSSAWEPEQRAALDAIYNDVFPSNATPASLDEALNERLNTRERDLLASGHFHRVEQCRYRWDQTYSLDDYLALIDTYSENRTLPEAKRADFYARLRQAIADTGNQVTLPYMTALFIAHR